MFASKSILSTLTVFLICGYLKSQCPGTNLCSICEATLTVTEFSGGTILNSTSTIDGTVLAGGEATGSNIQVQIDGCGEISMVVELDFVWEQGSGINWIHGVSFQSSDGWSAAEVVLPTDDWIFQDEITGVCFNQTFGQGYYFDPLGAGCFGGDNSSWDGNDCNGFGAFCEEDDPWLTDGDPSDNWGDNCEFNCPEFGFELSFCPQIADLTTETIGFFITDDAQTGGWGTDDNCIFDLNFIIEFIPQLPEEVNICEGDCVVLDAGTGCDSYLWSTGETTTTIEVCPTEETDYAITATSTNGCVLSDTITVLPEFCCEADAGELTGSNACPGEMITVSVSNYQDLPIYDQYLLLSSEEGIIYEVVNGTSLILESDVCDTFFVHAYNHYIGDDSPVPQIGDDINLYDCENNCCDVELLIIYFEDDEPPIFNNPLPNIEYDCIYNVEDAIDLNWMDNCGLSGVSTLDNEILDTTLCEGGTIERTWIAIDSCGNEQSHTQTIIVQPLAPPEFIDPPEDETQVCSFVPQASDLTWQNGLTDNCENSGTVTGVLNGTHDVCGGEYTIYWEYTDECNRRAEHTQTITVEEAPEAMFVDPPSNTSMSCEEIPSSFDDLNFTNNEDGVCNISGQVEAITTGTYDVCGGELLNTWTYIDDCNRSIEHTQQITVLPAEMPLFINPPQDITVSCGAVPLNSSLLNYSNSSSGDCLIEGQVMGTLSSLNPCTNSITEEWMFTDICGNDYTHSRIITVSDLEPIAFENIPSSLTLDCDEVEVNLIDLTFTNNGIGACLISGEVAPEVSGSYDACGGDLVVTWETIDDCGTTYTATQNITVLAATEASFSSIPTNTTITCNSIPSPQNLNVTNGLSGDCLISDTVVPTVSENYTACGGEIVYTWTFTDDCGRTIEANQTITITEADAPNFINTPEDITITCNEVGNFPNLINYTNNAEGLCLISGSSIALQTGSYDECGGIITQSWSETDLCGNVLTFIRTITVEQASPPEFVNPPEDITLNCGQAYIPPEELSYSNDILGECSISGLVAAEVDFVDNVYTHIWSFTDPCTLEEIEHVQFVTLSPDLSLTVDPIESNICLGSSFDLESITVEDNNGQAFEINYYEGFPSDVATQLFDLVVSPIETTLYTIRVFNDLGCEEEIPITIIVDLPPVAGNDNETELCVPGVVNLIELLGDTYTPGGFWQDLDGANVNLDNPTEIVINSQDPGVYEFSYTVQSGNSCQEDQAIISINYFELEPVEIDTIFCTNNNTTYTIELQSFGALILATEGEVVEQGGGIVWIIDIPIESNITINYLDPMNSCVGFLMVNPPNCNCPQVPAPEGVGDVICESDQVGIVYGIHEEGLILHWYEDINDDTPFLSGVDSLILEQFTQGIYTYFIGTESIEFPGCFSSTLTEVTLEVISGPPVTAPEDIAYCVNEEDLPVSVEFDQFNTIINNNVDNIFEYFLTLEEAYAQMNGFISNSFMENDSIYVRVTNLFGCYSIVGFELIINNSPELIIDVIDPNCLNDFGNVEIIQPEDLINYVLFLNGASISYPDGLTNLEVGSYSLEIEDINFCYDTLFFSIDEGVELNIESIQYVCNNAGTGTDSTDDFFVISFMISSTSNDLNSFSVIISGEEFGVFTYNEEHEITIPASGLEVLIEFIDSETNCFVEELSIPLNPCSTNCIINAEQLILSCNDNGTTSDPTDDEITITLNASNINGSASYIVQIDNVPTYVFDYGIENEFALPADGTQPLILLVDSEDNQCQLVLDDIVLSSCSSECSLNIESISLECNNNSTEDIENDDFYMIDVTIEIYNGSSTNEVLLTVDDNTPIELNYNEIEINLSADNDFHTIVIQDIDSSLCADTIQVGPLTPCSTPCSISLDFFETECFDNNTPMNSSDDYIEVTWEANVIDGATNNLYQLYIANNLEGSYAYGSVNSLNIPASNIGDITFELVDSEFENCTILEEINTSSCSFMCSLNADLVSVICDNNGTNNVENDDVFYIEILVSGNNVLDVWQIENEMQVYPYNEIVQLGPFNISDGAFELIITDTLNESCPFEIEIVPPNPCSQCIQSIEAGDSIEINCSMLTATLIGLSTHPATLYTWEGPQGIISNDSVAQSNSIGWHYFFANYADGCSLVDSVYVFSEDEIPISYAGVDSILTCDVQFIEIIGLHNLDEMYSSYWVDAQGNQLSINDTLTVVESGFYYFVVVNEINGCVSAPDEVFIGLNIEEPDALIFSNPSNILDCKIEMITLSYALQDHVIYEWMYNDSTSTEAFFMLDTTGLVILSAIDTISGCSSIDTLEIEQLEDFPIINIAPFEAINCLNTEILLDVSSSIPNVSLLFEWYNENGDLISNNPMIQVNEMGTYFISITDTISGCVNQDTIQVENIINQPSLNVSDDVSFNCLDTQAILTAEANFQGEYTWFTNDGMIISDPVSSEINVNSIGTYYVSFIDEVTFCEAIDSVQIFENFNVLSLSDWNIINESCYLESDGQINIGSIQGGTEPYSLSLDGEEILETDLLDLKPGDYLLQVVDAEGCELDTVFVIEQAEEMTIESIGEIILNAGENGELIVETNISIDEIDTIIWTPDQYLSCSNCLINSTNAVNDIEYTVTIINVHGCEISTSIQVRVELLSNIYTPNVFTPNDDGLNDFFTIFTDREMIISELAIFNRWGEKVFDVRNIPTNKEELGWDGKFKGENVNPGVFAFYAIVILPDENGEKLLKGDITVLK